MSKIKKYNRFLKVVFCIMGFTQIAAMANAAPDICSSGFNQRAYDLGVIKGDTIIDEAWDAIYQDCDTLVNDTYFKDRVLYILGATLSLQPGATDFVACHYYGYMAGVSAALQNLDNDVCYDECVQNGAFIGEIAAMLYCDLFIAYGGLILEDDDLDDLLEGILSVCGIDMISSCESTFESKTANYINLFGEICEPYTTGDYEDVWESAENSQCAFEI